VKLIAIKASRFEPQPKVISRIAFQSLLCHEWKGLAYGRDIDDAYLPDLAEIHALNLCLRSLEHNIVERLVREVSLLGLELLQSGAALRRRDSSPRLEADAGL